MALFVWLTTNCPLVMFDARTYVAATIAAAFAVAGNIMTIDVAEQFGAVTVVVAALAVSVTVPVAFDLPSVNCRVAVDIRTGSVSFAARTIAVIDFPQAGSAEVCNQGQSHRSMW